MLPISHKHRKNVVQLRNCFTKMKDLTEGGNSKSYLALFLHYIFHFHICSELFYPVTELISVVVCDSVDFKCEVISLTV